jgi:hypothetical protein
MEFKGGKRITTLVKAVPGIHWEERRGTQEEAIEYCKKDGRWQEDGTKKEHDKDSNQGKRTDIEKLMDSVKIGQGELELFENHPSVYFRYPKSVDRYRALITTRALPQFQVRDCRWYYGLPGTGKTRAALEEFPNAFILTQGNTGYWWTGYEGQTEVIVDDYRGGMSTSFLLRLTDGYRVQVPVHGGQVFLMAYTIIFTSNGTIDEVLRDPCLESNAAFKRRVPIIKLFERSNEQSI